MNINIKRLLIIAAIIIFPYVCFGQNDSVLFRIGAKMDRFTSNQPVEKIFLHLSSQYYNPGDTIWYKAYTVIGSHHQLSVLSGVLYVELYNTADSLITRQILPLNQGISWSDIHLGVNLKQGNYTIRAYTNWMRNFGADGFYEQQVIIGGTPARAVLKQPAVNPDVQFFPEGGELVNGVRSRIAFKAIGLDGLGIDVKGTIEDNEGNIVAEFASRHLGMGAFALIPQPGKTYKVKMTGNNNTPFTANLPKALDHGYTLAVNNSEKDSIYLKIAVNNSTLTADSNKTFYIIGQSAGKVYYTTIGKLQGLVSSAKVEKARFPTGIAQFTLFSQSGGPIAERIAYIENNDTLKLTLNSPATNYAARQKVKVDIQVKDANDKPVSGTFSMAVINQSRVPLDEDAESTIENNLLLTADIKGYIEKPNYYFNHVDEQKMADLDVLLLTQGYRSFEWKKILADSSNNKDAAIKYQPQQALELDGVLKTKAGKPVADGSITLISTQANILRDTITDMNGNFTFPNLFIADTGKIVLRARTKTNNNNVIIYAKQPGYPQISKANIPVEDSTTFSSAIKSAIKNNREDEEAREKLELLYKKHVLKEVVIRNNVPKKPDLRFSANLNGPGNANQVIMGDQIGGCITISDCLNGKVFGVTFRKGVPYSGRSLGPPTGMAVIVDGLVMTGKHLDDLDADDIYSIEVLRSVAYLAIYGSDASGGALVITTKRGGEDGYAPTNIDPKGLITYPFTGFYKAKTFYSPKYAHPISEGQLPDLRSTIYWNPNIVTDKDGKASFEYYNADTKGTYRIVVEGIDDNGNLGRQVYKYNVE